MALAISCLSLGAFAAFVAGLGFGRQGRAGAGESKGDEDAGFHQTWCEHGCLLPFE